MTKRKSGVGPGVTLGLFAAWLANDVEEWHTEAPWSQRHGVPGPGGVPARHVRVAIVTMGCVVGAAALAGARTHGRSPFYQAALLGFGLHGVGHVAASARVRGYTPGVLTSPTVVVPFWLWASGRLARAGIRLPLRRTLPAAALLTPGALALAHGTAAVVTRTTRHPAGSRRRPE